MLEFRELKEGLNIAVLSPESKPILKLQDIIDLLGDSYYHHCTGMIIPAQLLGDDFFELKTGFAGEILQKFSNYRMRLAVIGNFEHIESRSLQDFIRESNRLKSVNFLSSVDEAMELFMNESK